jgi:hypothetical protein
MKKISACILVFSLALFALSFINKQEAPPWNASQMVYPYELAGKLNDEKAKKPTIICVGKVDLIKTAIQTKTAPT